MTQRLGSCTKLLMEERMNVSLRMFHNSNVRERMALTGNGGSDRIKDSP